MPSGLHFPFRFDVDLLRADLATAQTLPWTPHYNEQDYGGNWSGIALRSTTGENLKLIAGSSEPFADTPLLDRCPYFRQVLATFQCPLKAVRLLSLAPLSFIREHSDHALGYDDGEIRVHVPIQTNPDVEFYVAGERLLLEEGHSYFVNVNLPHRVNNRGQSERIHLVIDAEVNEWVHALFRQGAAEGWHVPRCPVPPRNVDEFRRFVLANPPLQEQLQAIENPKRFSAAVAELGAAHGFEFHDGDLGAAIRCGPLPWQRDGFQPTSDWMPVHVEFRDGQSLAEWVYWGNRRITEPFFENSAKVALRHPFAQLFRCEAPLAIESSKAQAPAGFIFHMSRCGSTLISRMLSALPRHVMLSEPPPLDEVLQAKGQDIESIRAVIHALGQRRSEEESAYFIKMDAWHIHKLPLLRAAFPETPWAFVYRDPLEVLVSQIARPGKHVMQGAMDPDALAMGPFAGAGLSKQEWCARVLAAILQAALACKKDPQALFVNYRDLPDAVFGSLAQHFHLSLSDDDIARMRRVAEFNSKTPGLWFEPDAAAKQAAATTEIKDLCATHLTEIYRQVDA